MIPNELESKIAVSCLSSLHLSSRLLVKELLQFEEYRQELEILLTELANTNISKTYFQYTGSESINRNENETSNYRYGSNFRPFSTLIDKDSISL